MLALKILGRSQEFSSDSKDLVFRTLSLNIWKLNLLCSTVKSCRKLKRVQNIIPQVYYNIKSLLDIKQSSNSQIEINCLDSAHKKDTEGRKFNLIKKRKLKSFSAISWMPVMNAAICQNIVPKTYSYFAEFILSLINAQLLENASILKTWIKV